MSPQLVTGEEQGGAYPVHVLIIWGRAESPGPVCFLGGIAQCSCRRGIASWPWSSLPVITPPLPLRRPSPHFNLVASANRASTRQRKPRLSAVGKQEDGKAAGAAECPGRKTCWPVGSAVSSVAILRQAHDTPCGAKRWQIHVGTVHGRFGWGGSTRRVARIVVAKRPRLGNKQNHTKQPNEG